MGHGQMGERELEATMVKFVDGQADVLVSTAIVESGLDIPASNTIIINRADRFGPRPALPAPRPGGPRAPAGLRLPPGSRGRPGRRDGPERLRVIQELTELGSGLKLALRDLEIRGAGNLLGAQQHGHIAAVGFDLYRKLLAEAVRELERASRSSERVDPVITVDVEALSARRLRPRGDPAAGALQAARRHRDRGRDRGRAARSSGDRFGPLPEAAERLLDVVALRVAAQALGIERVEVRGGHALLTFAPSTPVPPERIIDLLAAPVGRRPRG